MSKKRITNPVNEEITWGRRRLESDNELKILIQEALVVGEISGDPKEFNPKSFMKRMRTRDVKKKDI